MDFNYYCKHCGAKLEFAFFKMQAYCETCKTYVQRENTIEGYTLTSRINQLKAMHNLMIEANDERIYMTWIYRMPDCPTEDDFVSIALDDEEYNECFDLFIKLITKKGNRY